MTCFYRVAAVLCAYHASAYRVQHSEGMQGMEMLQAGPEGDLRAAAVKSFKRPAPDFSKLSSLDDIGKIFSPRLELDRHSNTSIFEQTRSLMEEENPFAWAPNWSSSIGFGVDLKNESGVDALGLRKEWLSLCLQSIVMPEAPEGHEKAGFEWIKSGSCGADADTCWKRCLQVSLFQSDGKPKRTRPACPMRPACVSSSWASGWLELTLLVA
ncbi:unnamed protein product [Cladocopium goreaui]|uniref:Uncharacterized protein n=1 Tax=Cladocopium goreaui TaxID=2562237 RepID=A0A9P1G9L2_9DINO|nr:unnamed protein product [Cladocopium goreaui]